MAKTAQPYDRLAEYLLGKLGAEEARLIEEQISTDQDLQDLVAMFHTLTAERRSHDWGKLEPAAHALLDRLLADMKAARKKPKDKRGVVTFDSKLLPLPEGVRPATVDSRRIRYQGDGARLELSFYPITMNSYELIGQLVADRRLENPRVELKWGKRSSSVPANQFGLFRFPRVLAGKHTLKVTVDRNTVMTVEIEL